MNSLKKGEEIPFLNFVGGPGASLLNLEGGPTFKLYGVLGPTFKFWGGPGSQVLGSRGPGSLNEINFINIEAKHIFFGNASLLSVIGEWKNLDFKIRSSTSLEIFKKYLLRLVSVFSNSILNIRNAFGVELLQMISKIQWTEIKSKLLLFLNGNWTSQLTNWKSLNLDAWSGQLDSGRSKAWSLDPWILGHCVKKYLYLELFWSVFFRIRTECGEIWSISPYLVQM